MTHWFKFTLDKDLPRTTNRTQYYEMQRYLRLLRRTIIQKLNVEDISKNVVNNFIFGKSVMFHNPWLTKKIRVCIHK